VKIHPALFLYGMRLKHLILGFLFVVPIGCLASDNTAPGFLEGRLRIAAFKDVELAEGNPPKFSGGNYAEYPLIILTEDGKKQIARVTADENGKYAPHCRLAITSWMCRDGGPKATFGRNRNVSRLFQIRPCAWT
jgi:hypothetical protein